MNEQTILGHDCAWCGEPAVTTVEITPARFAMRPHPVTKVKIKTCIQAAITAGACAAHRTVRDRQGGPTRDPRQRPARAPQLDIYGGEVTR